MFSDSVPVNVDHRKLALEKGVIQGSIAVAELQRLASLLSTRDGLVRVDLVFSTGENTRVAINSKGTKKAGEACPPQLKTGDVRIAGQLQADVTLVCQSCLEEIEQKLEVNLALNIVASESDLSQPEIETLDTLIHADEGLLNLYDVVEDELILALPMAARHPDCVTEVEDNGNYSVNAGDIRNNPFAGLQKILKQTEE